MHTCQKEHQTNNAGHIAALPAYDNDGVKNRRILTNDGNADVKGNIQAQPKREMP